MLNIIVITNMNICHNDCITNNFVHAFCIIYTYAYICDDNTTKN